jgi:hypothetical protein
MGSNKLRYFDPKRGCTLNGTCQLCSSDIYVPVGIFTIYHGKKVWHNSEEKVMSVYHERYGSLCESCFLKSEEKEER